MPLTTRCRHCGRLFPVYAQQLKERRGKVACPQCGKRFDSIGGLLDEAIPVADIRRNAGRKMEKPRAEDAAPAEMLDLSAGSVPVRRGRAAFWQVGILLLTAGLILQIGWWDRGTWLQHPRVRAAADALCDRLGCDLGLPRLAGTMDIRQPLLAEQDEGNATLQLTLILVNRSSLIQRLPRLQLELYDESGTLAAARRFEPHQYLAGADIRRGLSPGSAVRPKLDIEPLPVWASGFRVKLF